jgi:hypothetical protein
LVLEDVIGGGGRSSNTSIQGPVTLRSGSLSAPPRILVAGNTTTPATDQFNRVVYDFALGDLGTGQHFVTYSWRLSDLGCYRNTTNDVRVNNAAGVTLGGGQSTISLMVNCTIVGDTGADDGDDVLSGAAPWGDQEIITNNLLPVELPVGSEQSLGPR